MKDDAEKVLVVERSAIEALGLFQGMVFDVEPYLRVLLDRPPIDVSKKT
jgi:hypothetical protein